MLVIIRKIFPLVFLTGLFFTCSEERIDFSTQVKPILNQRCISCHGGVKQNGGFSVLFREEALDTIESGKLAIIPGDPEHSEMIRRVRETDPERRMPFKEEPLSKEEIDILAAWIEQGAQWGDHWAYSPPQPVEVPALSGRLLSGLNGAGEPWIKNDIDYFILQKMNAAGLVPSPEADRPALIRRVYLDLTGLPPTPEQARKFFDDPATDAYEKVVDELLASPRYGEKWASWWLDLARYADTKGYEADPSRIIWRYRDYVIKSFNDDKPFDQFTIEQLAGDMLPNATDEQLIATAFHRNTMNNTEGGTDDEEFRTAAVIDRVNTTWEVFQSTTMSCVQCHSHPYDPVRHEEYFKSVAYFNNTRDEDVSGEHPLLRTYETEDEERIDAIRSWVLQHGGKDRAFEVTRLLKTLEPKYHAHVFDSFENGALNGHKWLSIRPGGSARIKQVDLNNKTHLYINYTMREPGGSFEIRTDHLQGALIARVKLEKASNRVIDIPLAPVSGKHDLYFLFENPRLEKSQSVCAIEWFSFQEDLPGKDKSGFESVKSDFVRLLNTKVANTPVLIESTDEQKRETHIFERGNWLVKGRKVSPGVPDAFNAHPDKTPPDRLAFAKWIVSRDNPLAARTIVNRIWEQIFGFGLVETLEDFGSQGAFPTHPELLDWLALRMMDEHHWHMKELIRDIVLSATYRQHSGVSDEALEKDQRNVWLARGARIRLSAEQIRDQALSVSGLLSDKMYGPSVMPFQPEGIWMSVYSGEKWTLSKGEDQYRRGVYTFIKRTSPYPSAMMFDGSSREVCVSRRIRTNTPLQALVTLNDRVFVDAARGLAGRMMASDPASVEKNIAQGYRLLTLKDIPDPKLHILLKLYDDAMVLYQSDTAAVHAITNNKNGSPKLAGMTVVANALLNLDEVIMKE